MIRQGRVLLATDGVDSAGMLIRGGFGAIHRMVSPDVHPRAGGEGALRIDRIRRSSSTEVP